MKEPYLEVTFRHGRPLAAYYYLPREGAERSHRTERVEHGILIDYSEDGRPIGLELTVPSMVTVATVNEVLRRLGQPAIRAEDLAPLAAA
jgi:uncharacterized protein YuzE